MLDIGKILTYHWHTIRGQVTLSGIGDPRWSYQGPLESGFPQTTDISVSSGWNLVAVPREQVDYAATSVFPGLYGAMFGYAIGYSPKPMLRPGEGYWVYYTSPRIVTISGVAPGILTTLGRLGWNIIGTRNYPVDLINVRLSGGNIIYGGPCLTNSA